MMYYKSDIRRDIGDRINPEEYMKNYDNFNKYDRLIAFSSKLPLSYIRYEYDIEKSSTENSKQIINIENFSISNKFKLKNLIIIIALLFILINKSSYLKKYF